MQGDESDIGNDIEKQMRSNGQEFKGRFAHFNDRFLIWENIRKGERDGSISSPISNDKDVNLTPEEYYNRGVALAEKERLKKRQNILKRRLRVLVASRSQGIISLPLLIFPFSCQK